MGYDKQGNWSPEDASVDTQVVGLLGKDNPYMKQARTQGLQTANARGFLNSSIAAGASQDAAIKAALPIAQQNAQQISQNNQQQADLGSKERIANLNVGAHDRQYLAAASADANKTYAAVMTELVKNNDLSSTNRNNYQTDAAARLQDQMSLFEQMYNVKLETSAPGIA